MGPISKSDLFDRLANSPSSWFGLADTLLKSASLVWAERHYIPHSVWVALMLRGYAVENLLKGLWVQQGNRLADHGVYERISGVADHDLVQMAKAVGVSTSNARTNVLHALSNAIRHLGRYPIPVNHNRMAVHTEATPDKKSLWSSEYEGEFWSLLAEWALRFEFLQSLPLDFLFQVMRDTWQQPCRPPDC